MKLDKVVFALAVILAAESVAAGTVGVVRDISQLTVLGYMGVMGVIFAAVVMSDVVYSRRLRRIEEKIDELAGGKEKERRRRGDE